MFGRIASKLAIFVLKNASLSTEDRNALTAQMLQSLSAYPLSSVVSVDTDGNIRVGNRSLDIEQRRTLHESARGAKNNVALKIIFDQVVYTAITLGLHKAKSDNDLLFSKAAIWFKQQLDYYLELLSGDGELTPTE